MRKVLLFIVRNGYSNESKLVLFVCLLTCNFQNYFRPIRKMSKQRSVPECPKLVYVAKIVEDLSIYTFINVANSKVNKRSKHETIEDAALLHLSP